MLCFALCCASLTLASCAGVHLKLTHVDAKDGCSDEERMRRATTAACSPAPGRPAWPRTSTSRSSSWATRRSAPRPSWTRRATWSGRTVRRLQRLLPADPAALRSLPVPHRPEPDVQRRRLRRRHRLRHAVRRRRQGDRVLRPRRVQRARRGRRRPLRRRLRVRVRGREHADGWVPRRRVRDPRAVAGLAAWRRHEQVLLLPHALLR